MKSPYKGLPSHAFWNSGVTKAFPNLDGLYKKKFEIGPDEAIATAGSCFAQHIDRRLRAANYKVLDMEPTPPGLPAEQAAAFGYGLYSARYGNIYTTQQLLQLGLEAFREITPELPVWEHKGRYYDALRPAIEPDGFSSHEEMLLHRELHLTHVRDLLLKMDVLIFTLGLTEHWYDKVSELVLPVAPGTIAGDYDEERHEFRNAAIHEVIGDFNAFQQLLLQQRNHRPFKVILTVSPVPLTATYEDRHVLVSTVGSKAILRAVVGQIAQNQPHVDYFPSFEIVTHPAARSSHYNDNLRTVTAEGVNRVMETFFSQHEALKGNEADQQGDPQEEVDMFVNCEEEMLARFGDD
ncbi:GSCFA domain-containing protein [Rhodovibrionaceae bacterium A322]